MIYCRNVNTQRQKLACGKYKSPDLEKAVNPSVKANRQKISLLISSMQFGAMVISAECVFTIFWGRAKCLVLCECELLSKDM